MRRLPLLFSLLVSFVLPGLTLVQTAPAVGQTATPVKDPQGVMVLSQAIAALGGASAIQQITDAVTTGSIAPIGNSGVQPATFVWKNAGSEFREQLVIGGSTRVFLSGHGSPANIRDGSVQTLPAEVAQANAPFHLPGLALSAMLADPAYSIVSKGPATVNGVAVIQVHLSKDTDPVFTLISPQDWYFDGGTGLPLRVEYRTPDTHNPANYDTGAFDFSNFQSVGQILVPFQLTAYKNGVQVAVLTIANVAFNQGISPTEFDAP